MNSLREQVALLIETVGMAKFLAAVCAVCVEKEQHTLAHDDHGMAKLWAFTTAQIGAVCERIMAMIDEDD